jgi:hypothetical protein
MKNKLTLLIVITALIFLRFWYLRSASPNYLESRIWSIQSIDVMKYSRDLAKEKLGDLEFNKTIDNQINVIASTGATHVAIGVPYDEEFLPIMRRWVSSARNHNLKVWFRGNLSGWEGWFDFKKIDRATHTKMISEYIVKNADLFEDGDLFSSCPECENGGPGDPRHVGDVDGYRNFLVEQTDMVRQSFRKIGKEILPNLHSMNGDVARLVMDKETTAHVGGYVVVDHYVSTPEKLVGDLRDLAKQSGGSIILGEFGAPIPDIHGNMTEQQQAVWVSKALDLLAKERSVVGLNYWTSFGGSTKLWNDNGTERAAANVLRGHFKPAQFKSQVVTWFDIPVGRAQISEDGKDPIITDNRGYFSLPLVEGSELTVTKRGFNQYRSPIASNLKIVLEPTSLLSFLRVFIFGQLSTFVQL